MNSVTMSYSQVLRFGWEKLKAHWKLLLMYMVLLVVFNALTGFIASGLENVSSTLVMVFNLAVTIAGLFLGIAQIKFILRVTDGRATSDLKAELMMFKEYLVSSTGQIIPYLVGSVAYALLVLLGLILLIVPGIIFAIKYQFVTYLIIDKDMGVKEAFRVSGELTQGKKMWLFGYALVTIGLVMLGLLALIVGSIVAAGVVMLGSMYIYRQFSDSIAAATPARVGQIA